MMTKKTRFALPHFYGFLEAMWHEKLVKKNTLKCWQDAVSEFQQVMDEDEFADLRCVDVKGLGTRYVDLLVHQRSSITPWRIYQLKNALAQAIGDFVAFTINPHEYKRTTSLALAKQIYLHNKASADGSAVVTLPAQRAATKISAAVR